MVNESGIFVYISVKCLDSEKVFEKDWKFWLPQKLMDAVSTIKERIHVNRAFDIDDSKCEKIIKFYVKKEPKLGFKLLVESLKKSNVDVEVIYEFKK
jgi:translation elongation factor EF-Ts